MNSYLQLFNQYFKQQLNSEHEDVQYVLGNGGKRFRPLLTIIWCIIAGGKVEDALPLAAAIECIHTMSLIQDDLPCMDNATERRGQKCLHLQTNEAQAILVSDYLFHLAYKFILLSNLNDSNKIQALSIMTNAISNTIIGQQYEFSHNLNNIEDYIYLHQNKTAALLSAACQLGVIASNNLSLLENADKFGTALGIGYQIQDDLQDKDGILNICTIDKSKVLLMQYISQCKEISSLHPILTNIIERIFNNATYGNYC